jgi:hypothetical protein
MHLLVATSGGLEVEQYLLPPWLLVGIIFSVELFLTLAHTSNVRRASYAHGAVIVRGQHLVCVGRAERRGRHSYYCVNKRPCIRKAWQIMAPSPACPPCCSQADLWCEGVENVY